MLAQPPPTVALEGNIELRAKSGLVSCFYSRGAWFFRAVMP